MSLVKDKRVVYGVLAAAALLVGAVVMYKYGDSEGGEEEIDIGPLKRDAQGYIEFQQFLKIFEISTTSAKTQFAAKKKMYIEERRKVTNDNEAY